MGNHISIDHNMVHIWKLYLPDLHEITQTHVYTLSNEEQVRASRYEQKRDQDRFTIVRALLRATLSLYTHENAHALTFHYGELGKPFLQNFDIEFNISHSADYALFAFRLQEPIGVDIQVISDDFKSSVAKRVFTPEEFSSLDPLDMHEKIMAFYKLWTRKEAYVKALGKGLFTPEKNITLSWQEERQTIFIQQQKFLIENILIDENYYAAFATLAPIEKIIYYEWTNRGPIINEKDF